MVGVHTCRDEFYLAMDDAELVNRLGNLYSTRQNLSSGVPDKASFEPVSSATETSYKVKFQQ